ncbi:hypothetical protein [Lysobacter gummosus]|uniref:hypothetical protein n=1 Tax=Lysobacter gummosus TaxID=262324 RepID=UPI00364115CA
MAGIAKIADEAAIARCGIDLDDGPRASVPPGRPARECSRWGRSERRSARFRIEDRSIPGWDRRNRSRPSVPC